MPIKTRRATQPKQFHHFVHLLPDCDWMILFPHLHHDFESVQRRRARPGNCSSSTTWNQVPPPHPRLLFLHGELIRNHQVLPHIDNLLNKEGEREKTMSHKVTVKICPLLFPLFASQQRWLDPVMPRGHLVTADDTDYFYSVLLSLNLQGNSRGRPHMGRWKPRLISCTVTNINSCFGS